MKPSNQLAALTQQVSILEQQLDAANKLIAELRVERDRLMARIEELETPDTPVPDPVPDPIPDPLPDPLPDPPPPPTGAWVPPMKAIQVPYTWPSPDVVLSPGDSIRTAYSSGKRNIKLNPGSYGSQSLGSMPGVKIWCETYRGAKFAGGTAPFMLASANSVLGNLQIESYGLHDTTESGAMLVSNGATNQWLINCAIGKSANNGVCWKGNKGGIRGGEFYDIPRYAWAGGSTDQTFEDIFLSHVAYLSTSSNRGVTKTTFSQRHILRRICGTDIGWQGIWFDIQNQPALIEDIYFDNIARNVVFIEVSYGGEQQTLAEWKRWRIRRVGGARPRNDYRSPGEDNWPTPAVVMISASSDVLIEDVYGTGWRVGVSLINPNGHKQIIKDPAQGGIGTCDRTRLGLQNITVVRQNTPGTTLQVAAIAGTAHTQWPEMKQPTGIKWIDPKWTATDKFRDFTGTVTQAQFRAKYT